MHSNAYASPEHLQVAHLLLQTDQPMAYHGPPHSLHENPLPLRHSPPPFITGHIRAANPGSLPSRDVVPETSRRSDSYPLPGVVPSTVLAGSRDGNVGYNNGTSASDPRLEIPSTMSANYSNGFPADAAISGSRSNNIEEITMSRGLPEDDGMASLRSKIHQIRDMALSAEEKAGRMHALMMADYETFKALRRRSVTNTTSRIEDPRSDHPAATSGKLGPKHSHAADCGALFDVTPTDLQPTYHPPSESADDDDDDSSSDDDCSHTPEGDEGQGNTLVLGCKHYMRNVKVQCVDCSRWYTCRYCHDEVEDHELVRKSIRNMLCMFCGLPQRAARYCRQCEQEAALYYCDKCKLWDNSPTKSIYHCDGCGICRRGEGLGKDFVHCDVSVYDSSFRYDHIDPYDLCSAVTSAFR